jgi:hypothetical protein
MRDLIATDVAPRSSLLEDQPTRRWLPDEEPGRTMLLGALWTCAAIVVGCVVVLVVAVLG